VVWGCALGRRISYLGAEAGLYQAMLQASYVSVVVNSSHADLSADYTNRGGRAERRVQFAEMDTFVTEASGSLDSYQEEHQVSHSPTLPVRDYPQSSRRRSSLPGQVVGTSYLRRCRY
jgi:hypothetical protein